ncbi:MAG: hypothetical protein ACR2MG_06925 [Pyrinomonadaceae bacterium]
MCRVNNRKPKKFPQASRKILLTHSRQENSKIFPRNLQGLFQRGCAMMLVFDNSSAKFKRILTPNRNDKQMKRTITEIFVEVEETFVVRQKEKNTGEVGFPQTDELLICSHCGQEITKLENLEETGEEI